MTEEFNLSEKIMPMTNLNDKDISILPVRYVKEFVKKEKKLIIEFMENVLNPNTKSKNFIEIFDFNFHLNNFIGKRSQLIGEDLK